MPDGINNVDNTIIKLAEQYHSTQVRSQELNEERATIRENVEKLGIDPIAFQAGIRMVKAMTAGERSDYTVSLTRVLSVLDGKEADLFNVDVADREEKAQKRAEKSAKDGRSDEELDDTSDDNPRSNPDAGGAGKKGRKKKAEAPAETIAEAAQQSDAALAESIAATQAQEQKDGEEILSQSAKANQKRAEAGVP